MAIEDLMNKLNGQGGGMPPEAQAMAPPKSMLNINDVAQSAAQGQISPDMTVGQFMETNLGLKWDDPLSKFIAISKDQLKNSSMAGKLDTMAGGASGGMPPQGAPKMPMGM